ncbi:uncharacterized protein [Antedon mediterranea]|uniref:uncharacterized protein n=1 Tax=Antedon mediterranea TaxID=105859 RepID=UPI003AF57352
MTTFKFDSAAIPIKRLDDVAGSTFNRFYKNKRPVLLTGIAKDWLPLQTWNEEYIKDVLYEEFGEELKVLKSNDNKHFINHVQVSEKIEISLERFLDAVFHAKDTEAVRYYLRTHSMPSKLYQDMIKREQVEGLIKSICHVDSVNCGQMKEPESSTPEGIVKDIYPWEEFLDSEETCDHEQQADQVGQLNEIHDQETGKQLGDARQRRIENVEVMSDFPLPYQAVHQKVFRIDTMQLWLGTKGNITPLHFDRNHGLLLQVIGCKELVLFSHTDTPLLYPHPSHTSRSHTSKVNLRDIDSKRFPHLKHAQRYTCVLNPGEILYTPPFWWHDVTSLDGCLSVTLPWDISIDEIPLNMLM